MKMHKVIGEARASTRSIFTLALVGVLLSFTGQAFGQAEEEEWVTVSGPLWIGRPPLSIHRHTLRQILQKTQGLNDLDAVDGNVIRFNGATGPAGHNWYSYLFGIPDTVMRLG